MIVGDGLYMSGTDNTNSKIILSHIVSITESRDIEILEISLLWTIFELIPCKRVFLVKASVDDTMPGSISEYGPQGYDEHYDPEKNSEIKNLAISLLSGDESQAGKIEAGSYSGFIVFPVNIRWNQIGFIAVEMQSDIDPAIHLLEGLARIYQNYVSILMDNQTDTLTGILNRKTFDDRIMKLVELKKREKKQFNEYNNERRTGNPERFWLGIFDIDNFKKVNDTFGHIYGDEILILVSRIMQNVFRADDMKFRFGGEEFIIVMKADSFESAYSVFERFRKDVAGYVFPQTGQITVSIGIVEITGEQSPSVFVGCADKALYYAKEHGRNMTCYYNDLVERGLVSPEAVRKGEIIMFDE